MYVPPHCHNESLWAELQSGNVLVAESHCSWSARNTNSFQIKSRVIVDPHALARAARSANLQSSLDSMGKTVGGNAPQSDIFFSPNRAATQSFERVADEDLCLCPPTLPVFTLEEQEWLNVTVEGIRDIEWEKEAFEKIVLAKDKKEMLRKVSQAHAIGGGKRTEDVIGNKGKGLVMLYHGPPGQP